MTINFRAEDEPGSLDGSWVLGHALQPTAPGLGYLTF